MKNLLLVLFLLALLPTLPGQTFGVHAGLEQQLLVVRSTYGDPDQPWVDAQRPATGLSAGAFVRWPLLVPGLYFQPEVSVALIHNDLYFYPGGTEVSEQRTLRFTELELPMHLVYIQPRGNYALRPTLSLGGRLGVNIAPQADDRLHLLRERAALDAGIGVVLKLGAVHLHPEMLYSRGLNNLHDFQNRAFDPFVGSILRDRVTFRVLVYL